VADGTPGRLEKVGLRSVWLDEARDFTPWLAANLDVLAAELGLGPLTVKQREFAVGSYSLDILAEDASGRLVAIENQLEWSDHRHLGQCLTYASGTAAWAVVWLVAHFNEEHRSALDWLNQHTDTDVHFFGVELDAVRIGDSVPAPLFRVVVRPNDWERIVKRDAGPSKAQSLDEYLAEAEATLGPAMRAGIEVIADHWTAGGGYLTYGSSSVYLNMIGANGKGIWPCGIRCSSPGRVEYALQPLSIRPPFDDEGLREELCRRVNAIPGVVPPIASSSSYPSVLLAQVLTDEARPVFLALLDWFSGRVAVGPDVNVPS
jgi:hypothetical protein